MLLYRLVNMEFEKEITDTMHAGAPDSVQRPPPLFAWVMQRLMALLRTDVPRFVLDEMVRLWLAIEDTLSMLATHHQLSMDPLYARDMTLHMIRGKRLS